MAGNGPDTAVADRMAESTMRCTRNGACRTGRSPAVMRSHEIHSFQDVAQLHNPSGRCQIRSTSDARTNANMPEHSPKPLVLLWKCPTFIGAQHVRTEHINFLKVASVAEKRLANGNGNARGLTWTGGSCSVRGPICELPTHIRQRLTPPTRSRHHTRLVRARACGPSSWRSRRPWPQRR